MERAAVGAALIGIDRDDEGLETLAIIDMPYHSRIGARWWACRASAAE